MIIRPFEKTSLSNWNGTMGWVKKRKVDKNESTNEGSGMNRREFLRSAGIGAAQAAIGIAGASAFLKTTGLGKRDAKAADVTRHRTEVSESQINNLPGGVRIGAEHHGLKEAWVYLHEDIYDHWCPNV